MKILPPAILLYLKTLQITCRRNDWIITADSSWGEGYSTGTLKESHSKGKALFSGELVTRYLIRLRIKSGFGSVLNHVVVLYQNPSHNIFQTSSGWTYTTCRLC